MAAPLSTPWSGEDEEFDVDFGDDHVDAGAQATLSPRRDTTVVYLVGDIDLATAAGAERQLLAAVDDAVLREVPSVSVDLSGVGIIDSTGLSALVRGFHAARHAGVLFSVVDASPSVRRLFTVTQMSSVFNLPDE
jgi:anti-sigma B factor antagonist